MPVPSCVATIGLAQDSSTGQAGTAPCGRRHCGEGGVTRVPSSFGSSLLPRLCKQQTPHEKLILCVLIPNCRSHHLRSVRWPFECPSNPHRKFPTTSRPVETFSFLPSSPEHLKLFPLSTSRPKGLLPKHPEKPLQSHDSLLGPFLVDHPHHGQLPRQGCLRRVAVSESE